MLKRQFYTRAVGGRALVSPPSARQFSFSPTQYAEDGAEKDPRAPPLPIPAGIEGRRSPHTVDIDAILPPNLPEAPKPYPDKRGAHVGPNTWSFPNGPGFSGDRGGRGGFGGGGRFTQGGRGGAGGIGFYPGNGGGGGRAGDFDSLEGTRGGFPSGRGRFGNRGGRSRPNRGRGGRGGRGGRDSDEADGGSRRGSSRRDLPDLPPLIETPFTPAPVTIQTLTPEIPATMLTAQGISATLRRAVPASGSGPNGEDTSKWTTRNWGNYDERRANAAKKVVEGKHASPAGDAVGLGGELRRLVLVNGSYTDKAKGRLIEELKGILVNHMLPGAKANPMIGGPQS